MFISNFENGTPLQKMSSRNDNNVYAAVSLRPNGGGMAVVRVVKK